MDVSESQARREVELAKRLLKQRDEDHVRELDNLKESQAQQLSELDANQTDNLKRIQKKAEEETSEARANYENKLSDATDNFERQVNETKQDAYDKFGRLNAQYAREKASAESIKARQMRDMGDSDKYRFDVEKREREGTIDNLRKKFDDDRLQLKRHYDQKMTEQAEQASDLNSRTVVDARDRVDSNIRSNSEELSKEKMAASLRLKKLAEDSTAERESMKRAHDMREGQLAEEKNFSLKEGNASAAKAYEEYRERASDSFNRAINDSNFIAAQKERDHANALAIREQEHQKNINEKGSQFRKAEAELRLQNKAEKSRNDLKESLTERRHQQDVQLSNEALRKSNALSSEIMRSRYNDQLRELEEKSQQKFGELAQNMQQKMTEQELRTANERANTMNQKNKELADNELTRNQEKYLLNKMHDDRYTSNDTMRRRQLEDQKNYYHNVVGETKEGASKEISKRQREHQTKLFLTQEELKNQTRELEEKRKMDLDASSETYRERVKRLTQNYNRAIMSQQDNFNEATEGLRSENTLQRAKDRGDTEHERKMQLYELQSKNRIQAIAYENKINDLKDEAAAELAKQKAESDKAMRSLIKKTKEAIEKDNQLHARDIESKDRQMKERLKLQEDAFREQLERLKRSNELTLKKS